MKYSLDMRTKIILLVFVNALLLFPLTLGLEISLIIGLTILLCLEGQWKRALVYLFAYVCLVSLEAWFLVAFQEYSFLNLFAVGGRRLLPVFLLASSIFHGSQHELIYSLRYWHFPESFLLAIIVMRRFLPTLASRIRQIWQSLRSRGIIQNWYQMLYQPLKVFEYFLVPLLIKASEISQDLTLAGLTKSVSRQTSKSSYKIYRLSWLDVVTLVASLIYTIILFLEVVK